MNRIKTLRIARQWSQKELAAQLGVRQNTLSTWETGRYEPDNDSILKLAVVFGVSTDYLLGKTDILSTPTSSGKWIPVLGDVAAGIPIEAVENIIDHEEISAQLAATGDFFALRIKGSSMEPKISDGDVVIVRKQSDADTGDTAIVLVNGDSATCKRIKKEEDGSLWLLPTNPAYEARHFSPSEIQSTPVSIIGKVVELRAKF